MENKSKTLTVMILLFVILFAVFIAGDSFNTINKNSISLISSDTNNVQNINHGTVSPASNSQSLNSSAFSPGNIQANRSYFANALGINESGMNETLAEKFSNRKTSDSQNVQNVIKLAKLASEEKRTSVSEELLNMTEGFVKRITDFSDKSPVNKENVRIQIEKYQDVLKQKKEIKLNITNDGISGFFSNHESPEDFIDSLFN